MLSRVRIRGFRSCQDVTIDHLRPVTALVGCNAAGKTNLLKAIHWGARMAVSGNVHDAIRELAKAMEAADSAGITLEATLEGVQYEYSLDVLSNDAESEERPFLQESFRVKSENEWTTLVEREKDIVKVDGRDDPLRLDRLAPALASLESLLPESPAINEVGHFLGFLRNVRFYSLEEPNDPASPDFVLATDYAKWLRYTRSADVHEDSTIMRIVHMHLQAPEKLDELRQLLGPKGLGLVDALHVDAGEVKLTSESGNGAPRDPTRTRQKFYQVFFPCSAATWSGSEGLTYHQLSHGTRRILHLLAALILDESSLLLIEHPEDGIHSGLLEKLIGILNAYAEPDQVIFSTHSPAVLNQLRASAIRLVTMGKSGTEVRHLTPEEIEHVESYIAHDGVLFDALETIAED